MERAVKNSEVIFKIPFLFLPVCWGRWGPQWGFASFPAPVAFPEVLFSQASLRGFCRQTHLAAWGPGGVSVWMWLFAEVGLGRC